MVYFRLFWSLIYTVKESVTFHGRNGEWEWLVEFDGNVVLDLHTLGSFLDKYVSKPLLLLDWSYHEDCGDDGFQCFSRELNDMLRTRRKYIEDSKENIEAWQFV